MNNVLGPLSAYLSIETEMPIEGDTIFQLWTTLQWFFKILMKSLRFIEISKFIHEMRKLHWLTRIFLTQILIQWYMLLSLLLANLTDNQWWKVMTDKAQIFGEEMWKCFDTTCLKQLSQMANLIHFYMEEIYCNHGLWFHIYKLK